MWWSKGPWVISWQNNPGDEGNQEAGNNWREERKNLQAHTLALLLIGFKLGFADWVQGHRLMLFSHQPILHAFTPWFLCSHQAGVAACSKGTEKQVGAGSRAIRYIGWLHQNCLDNLCWTVSKTNVHSAFCRGKASDPLESLSHRPPTYLLYVHILWLVLKHLAFTLQHTSFLQALMHLSSQINVREELLTLLARAGLLMEVS